MYLSKITLVNYKNFEYKTFNFKEKINCFIGDNGIGKTNVMDAVYHLSLTKSYFNTIFSQNIRHGANFFMLEGQYHLQEGESATIVSSFKKGQKRIFKKNAKVYDRISDHIGKFPLVIISPSDQDLITSGSELRRKFMDNIISQQDTTYLQDLLAYQKTLMQRNALLKFFAANAIFDEVNLQVYDEQLAVFGTRIHQKRKAFWKNFEDVFNARYQTLSRGREKVSLSYESVLDTMDMQQVLKNNLHKDRVLQYTNSGVHRDDLLFEIQRYPIKKFGSQGQQKSYLIALKLAQFDIIYQKSGFKPIFLLDDIFDKLDNQRVEQLIALINQDDFGQIFITDTHLERTENMIKATQQSYQIFNL